MLILSPLPTIPKSPTGPKKISRSYRRHQSFQAQLHLRFSQMGPTQSLLPSPAQLLLQFGVIPVLFLVVALDSLHLLGATLVHQEALDSQLEHPMDHYLPLHLRWSCHLLRTRNLPFPLESPPRLRLRHALHPGCALLSCLISFAPHP